MIDTGVLCINPCLVNPVALRKAKIVYNFGLSECSRVKDYYVFNSNMALDTIIIWVIPNTPPPHTHTKKRKKKKEKAIGNHISVLNGEWVYHTSIRLLIFVKGNNG